MPSGEAHFRVLAHWQHNLKEHRTSEEPLATMCSINSGIEPHTFLTSSDTSNYNANWPRAFYESLKFKASCRIWNCSGSKKLVLNKCPRSENHTLFKRKNKAAVEIYSGFIFSP